MKNFKHQDDEIREHWADRSRAIFWEQGTGKSRAALRQFKRLVDAGLADCMIVVAPNGVHENWVNDEIPKHLADQPIIPLIWSTARAVSKKWARNFEQFTQIEQPIFLAISYDSFVTKNGKNAVWRLFKTRKVFYVLDESHHVKSASAIRTKSIVRSGEYADYRRILTGTPISKPFDIYSQLRFVNPDVWKPFGIQNYHGFKQFFGVWIKLTRNRGQPDERQFPVLTEYKNLDILKRVIAENGSRVLKEDVLDLPPKLFTKRHFDLSPQQSDYYELLREQLYIEHESGNLTNAALPIVKLLRFQQITSGYVGSLDDDGNKHIERIPGPNPRLDLFSELAEEVPTQAIVWARFRSDLDQIQDRLSDIGHKWVRYDGSVDQEQRARNKRAFIAGDTQWFLGNPQVGAEGLTLLGAKQSFFYSNSFSLIKRLQAEDRPHRIGQDVSCLYTDLIGRGSVDEHIVTSLREGFDMASDLNGDRLREWI